MSPLPLSQRTHYIHVLDKWPGYFKHAYRSCLMGALRFQLVPPAFFDWSHTAEFMRKKRSPSLHTHAHACTHARSHTHWCSVPSRSRPLAGKSMEQTCSDKDIAFMHLPVATVGPDKTGADGQRDCPESLQALRPATAKKCVWATSSQRVGLNPGHRGTTRHMQGEMCSLGTSSTRGQVDPGQGHQGKGAWCQTLASG